MNESSWETSRREGRRKKLIAIVVTLLLTAVATVLFLNNRDLIETDQGETTQLFVLDVNEPSDRPAPDTMGANGAITPSHESGQPVAKPNETVQKVSSQGAEDSLRDISREKRLEGSRSMQSLSSSCGPVVSKNDVGTEKIESNYCSIPLTIKLPAIGSGAERGKNVVIHLSLELFFNDIEQREAILLHREEIKVVVARIMGKKELRGLKVRELEADLLHTLNTALFSGDITTVKIRNIQVDREYRGK